MSGHRSKACPRCGMRIYAEAALCRDCREGDPVYLRLTQSRPPRSRARINTVIPSQQKENS